MVQKPQGSANDNAENSVKTNLKSITRRRLRHKEELFGGGVRYSAMPQDIVEPWRARKFPESKFRILELMLNNSEHFHVTRGYLEAHFDSRTIKKYIDELVSEGVLEIEWLPLPKRGRAKIYHVNYMSNWRIKEVLEWKENRAKRRKSYSEDATSPNHPVLEQGVLEQGVLEQGVLEQGVLEQGVLEQGVLEGGLNKTNPNQTNSNKTKMNRRGGSGYPQPAVDSEKVHSKWGLVGRIAALYDAKTKRVVFEGLVEQLQLLFKDKDIIALIEHYEDLTGSRDSELIWRASHTARWKKQIAEGYAFTQSSNSSAPYRSLETEQEPGFA